nr:Flavin-dependent monooxygenase (oxygenase subunit) [Paraburkholderia sp.]
MKAVQGDNQSWNMSVPTEEELVERARAMIPMLRGKASEVEKARAVPEATIQIFREAGFFKILQPKRWDGWEMNLLTFQKVLMELGRGCPSSAWNMMILGIHQWEFGVMDPRAGDEMWSKDSSILMGSSYAPFGQCRKVDGGWIISGTWKTSSGCDHADGGSFLGARWVDEQGVMRDHRAFLVSRSDYELIDDWHVMGLAGTGSKSIKVKEAFVPDYRSHSVVEYKASDRSPAYLYPFNQAFFSAVSAVLIGFARGMVDIYIEQMKPRQNIFGPAGGAAENPYVKDKLGNAVLLVRGARARIMQVMAETAAYTEKGQTIPLEERVHHYLEIQRCGRDCLDASIMLWKKLSARAIWLDNPAQLWTRAIMVAANHVTQNEDDSAGLLGGYLLGQGTPPFVFDLPKMQ